MSVKWEYDKWDGVHERCHASLRCSKRTSDILLLKDLQGQCEGHRCAVLLYLSGYENIPISPAASVYSGVLQPKRLRSAPDSATYSLTFASLGLRAPPVISVSGLKEIRHGRDPSRKHESHVNPLARGRPVAQTQNSINKNYLLSHFAC